MTVQLGYVPTLNAAIGLAAIMRILDSTDTAYEIRDFDDNAQLLKAVSDNEIDLFVPYATSEPAQNGKPFRILSEMCREGYVVCSVNDKKPTEIYIPAEFSAEWEEFYAHIEKSSSESHSALNALKPVVQGLDEILDRVHENKSGSFAVFLPTPCELLHYSYVKPVHGLELYGDYLYIAGVENLSSKLDELVLDEINHLLMGNKVLSSLIWAVEKDEMDPEEAVSAWLRGRLLGR